MLKKTKSILGYAMSVALGFSAYSSATTLKLVASGYTDKGGEGVYGLTYDTTTNQFSPSRLLAKNNNPSFGLKNKNLWYFVDEASEGQLLTYNQNDKDELNFLQKVSTSGKWPCYITKRKDDKYIAVANYGSGNLTIYALDEKGVPQPKPQLKQQKGSGPVGDRQESAHAHWAGWAQLANANKTMGIYSIDLGADKIFWYPQNANGTLEDAQVAYKATPGDGPRHMAFHPQKPWVYIVNELSNTLSFTQQDTNGRLTEVQKISTLPADFKGKNTAAHIVIAADGKHIYTSNRGDLNSLSVFTIADDGRVTLTQNLSSQGKVPRFFLLLEDAKKMLVVNQESDNLVAMNVLADGKLEYSGVQTQIPKPTFLGLQ